MESQRRVSAVVRKRILSLGNAIAGSISPRMSVVSYNLLIIIFFLFIFLLFLRMTIPIASATKIVVQYVVCRFRFTVFPFGTWSSSLRTFSACCLSYAPLTEIVLGYVDNLSSLFLRTSFSFFVSFLKSSVCCRLSCSTTFEGCLISSVVYVSCCPTCLCSTVCFRSTTATS